MRGRSRSSGLAVPRSRALFLWGWTGMVAIVSVILIATAPSINGAIWVLLAPAVTVPGVVIATHRPGVIGRLLLVIGAAVLADQAVQPAVASPPTGLDPELLAALLIANTAWLAIFLPLFHVLYVFPDGTLLSPRWRWVYGMEAAVVVTLFVLGLFSEQIGPPSDAWLITNPIGFIPIDLWDGPFALLWACGLLSIPLGGAIALTLRWRRSPRDVRIQIKWVMYGGVITVIGYTVSFLGESWAQGTDLFFGVIVAIVALPVSIAVAVLRYRLYDIDRIVSRTVTYTLLIGVLAAVYGGAVALLTQVLPVDSNLAVATATLAAATLFAPFRRRIQRTMDRRFNRTRYQAEQELDAFGTRLRDTTDVHGVETDLAAVIERTLQPTSVGVWIRTPSG